MIRGVGADLCDVARMRLAIHRTGPRLLARILGARERDEAERAPDRAAYVARRFALKEATFKVLGRGWPSGIGYDEVDLPPGPSGPVALSGRAVGWAERAGITSLHGATSCDGRLALAVVIGWSAADAQSPGGGDA